MKIFGDSGEWGIGDIAATAATGGLYAGYKGVNDTRKDNKEAKQNYLDQIDQLNDPYAKGGLYEGMDKGYGEAEKLYGMNREQIGGNVQDIVSRRKAMLDAEDPASSQLRDNRNTQLRMAKAMGSNPMQMAQVNRQAQMDISRQLYANKKAALADYQSLMGNIAGNTYGMAAGYGGLAVANKTVPGAPEQKGLLSSLLGGIL